MGDWELVKPWNEQNNTLNSQVCYYLSTYRTYTLLVYTKVNIKVNAKIKHQIKIKYKQVKKHNSYFIKLFQVKKNLAIELV